MLKLAGIGIRIGSPSACRSVAVKCASECKLYHASLRLRAILARCLPEMRKSAGYGYGVSDLYLVGTGSLHTVAEYRLIGHGADNYDNADIFVA